MARKARELSALELSRKTQPGLHFVGAVAGLALQVLPSGGRSWVLRAVIAGRRRDMGLGGYPDVTLAEARERAREKRRLIDEGIDPIEARRAKQSALAATRAASLTFDQCAVAYIKAHESGWRNTKHAQQWRNTLSTYASPIIGELLVRDVGQAHVLAVLEPIWKTKTETASRLRARIQSVLDWASVRGYRSGENPARWHAHLDKLLAKPSKVAKVEHHRALPVDRMGAFMSALRAQAGMGARALEFAILTAARSGEVRGATWSEIDLKNALWSVPASRMKAGKEHRVPLCDAALVLLRELPRLAGCDYLFWSRKGGMLSDMTLLGVVRRMHVDAVPHGFRSTFRDWAAERTAYPREVAEMALAHSIGDKVEAAYRRGDLFEKRRRMMDDWAAFLALPQISGDVVPLRTPEAA